LFNPYNFVFNSTGKDSSAVNLYEDLYKVVKNLQSPLDCLTKCKNYTMFTIASIEGQNNSTFSCTCLNNYKFRPEDISDECMPNWFPGLNGPFSVSQNSSNSTSYGQAIYVKKNGPAFDGSEYLLPYDKVNICEGNDKKALPRSFGDCQDSYLECRFSMQVGRNQWVVTKCPQHQRFSRLHGECTSYCTKKSHLE